MITMYNNMLTIKIV